MNRLEQSLVYLRQYLQARRTAPWIVAQHPSIEAAKDTRMNHAAILQEDDMTITPANGITGHLLRSGYDVVFRVYDGTTFTDYDLTHSDLCVTITDPDAAFYSEPRSDRLDHSPATLGITD